MRVRPKTLAVYSRFGCGQTINHMNETTGDYADSFLQENPDLTVYPLPMSPVRTEKYSLSGSQNFQNITLIITTLAT